MSSEAATAPGDSLEPIKRVTITESEVEAKVAKLRDSAKVGLDALQRETEEVLARTRSDAEKAHDATVAEARAEGDREAQQILDVGKVRADVIKGRTAADLAPAQDALFTAVLADFRPPPKKGSA